MRQVLGLEGQYSVTEDGKIWSLKTKKFISSHKTRSGYERVTLRDTQDDNKAKHFLVHRLVAQAYVPNPQCKDEVNHINSIRDDNRVENLEWATRSENNQHAWDYGNKVFVKTDKFVNAMRENAKIATHVRMMKHATRL